MKEENKHTAEIKFNWKGDLEDDCSVRVGNILAHCELLGEIEWRDPEERRFVNKSTYWFCSVGPVDRRGMRAGNDLFHSGEHEGAIYGGHMARAIAESIIRAYFSKATATKGGRG